MNNETGRFTAACFYISRHQSLQFFMTFLDVTKIHNFLSVLKYVAKIVIILQNTFI